MPLARSVAATRAASTSSLKSIVPTTSERLAGSATNGSANVEAAAPVHPLDLVGEQQQGRQRGRVVGLVLARVVQRGLQREELGDPAAARGQLVDALDGGGADDGQPQAAVGGEGLLRREVVGVGLR